MDSIFKNFVNIWMNDRHDEWMIRFVKEKDEEEERDRDINIEPTCFRSLLYLLFSSQLIYFL